MVDREAECRRPRRYSGRSGMPGLSRCLPMVCVQNSIDDVGDDNVDRVAIVVHSAENIRIDERQRSCTRDASSCRYTKVSIDKYQSTQREFVPLFYV